MPPLVLDSQGQVSVAREMMFTRIKNWKEITGVLVSTKEQGKDLKIFNLLYF